MGARYLTDLADVLRRAGVTVVELDGWQDRARSSGGYDGGPLATFWHHTASAGDGAADAEYCTFGSDDAPVCNVVVGRDGVVYVCAAGATNTNGKGGPHTLPSGVTIPQDGANARVIGMELSSDGVGMTYPAAQMAAAFAVSTACAAAYGLAADDVVTHQVWAPSRKIDPATAEAVEGDWWPTPVTSSGTWSLEALRDECRRLAAGPDPIPTPDPPEDDDMSRLYLVLYPGTSTQYVTDLATFKTAIASPAVAWDGVACFGWNSPNPANADPWSVGPDWAPFLDALPTTAP